MLLHTDIRAAEQECITNLMLLEPKNQDTGKFYVIKSKSFLEYMQKKVEELPSREQTSTKILDLFKKAYVETDLFPQIGKALSDAFNLEPIRH